MADFDLKNSKGDADEAEELKECSSLPDREPSTEQEGLETCELPAADGDGTAVISRKEKLLGDVFDCVETFCYALVLMVVLFLFVFRYVSVDGSSMMETLKNEDKLIISNLFYTPETGDIVVLTVNNVENPILGKSKPIIKRIIATEGQEVTIDFNK